MASLKKYSSYASHVGSEFEDEKQQKIEVASLVQANKDLIKRYSKLKKALSLTNATVKVTIEGVELTISEWITFRTTAKNMHIKTLEALNTTNAGAQLNSHRANLEDGVPVSIVRCYDEKERVKNIEDVENIYNKIDATLERINATTDLVEEVL